MTLPPLVDHATPFDATIEVVYERRNGALTIVSVRVGPLAERANGLPTLANMERAHIAAALAVTGGRRAAAARLLEISERNLYRKIRRFGLTA